MQHKIKTLLLISIAAVSVTACKYKTSLVTAKDYIQNLPTVLVNVNKLTKINNPFPQKVAPQAAKFLFASLDTSQAAKNFYVIHIGATKNCNGAHYCEIGSEVISAKKPDLTQSTQTDINNGLKAYYIAGTAKADYWLPSLTWEDKQRWYTLSWKLENKNAKETLLRMVNSAYN